ncbi:hypothetical protein F5884DRAFT_856498 [Xylogone sp. PMI_703]|nr:hypothetical protein F5884DRAFT_856498 [Xylogone sp. PMI_703]
MPPHGDDTRITSSQGHNLRSSRRLLLEEPFHPPALYQPVYQYEAWRPPPPLPIAARASPSLPNSPYTPSPPPPPPSQNFAIERNSHPRPIVSDNSLEQKYTDTLKTFSSHDAAYKVQSRHSRRRYGRSSILDKALERKLPPSLTVSDHQAADMVKQNFKRGRRHPPCPRHEHYLRGLIKRQHDLDAEALDAILVTMDAVFFNRTLSGRVRWKWSNPTETRYQTEFVGATALRHAAQGGFETLVILSDPILRRAGYSRKLLLTAFLHELIHCYLFICCGFEAKVEGGHTKGFHDIAATIDEWIGPGYLKLCDMEANLSEFLEEDLRMQCGMHCGTGRR